MTVLCDYSFLDDLPTGKGLGTFETPFVIGDAPGGATQAGRFEKKFSTGGLHHAPALVSMMVRGLSRGSARVAIKGPFGEHNIGRLEPTSNRTFWRHEQFTIPTNVLGNGNSENALVIGRVNDNAP